MSPKTPNNIKNLIEMREIKNFKTQKFKRIKNQLSYYSQFYIHHHHHHHVQPLQYKHFTTNFNSWRIYRVTPSSPSPSESASASSFSSNLIGTSLVQVASAMQLSIISSSCIKMCLIIVLLLSIVASHIATCHAILERDNNNILVFNQNNMNLSEHLLQYLRTKQQNLTHKSLIVDSQSTTINNDIVKFVSQPATNSSSRRSRSNHSHNIKKIDQTKSNELESYHNSKTLNKRNRMITPDMLSNRSISNQSTHLDAFNDQNQDLLKIVMEGLGIQTLPDYKAANISQQEYVTKYNEYIDRIRKRNLRELQDMDYSLDELDYDESNLSLKLLTIPHNSSEARKYRLKRSPNKDRLSPKGTILLRFPLNVDSELKASDIEEANIRLLLITGPALATPNQNNKRQQRLRGSHKGGNDGSKKIHSTKNEQKKQNSTSSTFDQKPKPKNPANKTHKHVLNMKVFQLLEPKGRVWLDGRKIEIKIDRRKMDETTSQWLQFDVTKAVEAWLINKQTNLGLEIQCDNCIRNGARIIDDLFGDSEEDVNSSDKYDLTPVLNIVGRLGTHREKRSKIHHNQMTEKPSRRLNKSNCYKDNQRCCRHTMEVIFKEIKGFEFIIQPKAFDAGYCRGRCPPRYNPAHHHALLQSLIWKQDRAKVPRPCCAPSKLIELEVLHVDEKDNEKLKISTWTDMRVLECACS